MSSTKRSDVRQADDHYVTPDWVVGLLLDAIPPIPSELRIVDPGCGDGAILTALKTFQRVRYGDSEHLGVELNKGRADAAKAKGHSVIVGDFLKAWKKVKNVDAVVMNPPYSLALDFVQASLNMVRTEGLWKPGGFVAALLRLSFLASQKRRAWWHRNPADVYVLSRRPSFTGGGTDSCDYAWFTWKSGPTGRITIL